VNSFRSIRVIGPILLLVLSLTSMVSADFTGLSVEPVEDPAAAGAGLQAFDLFASFDGSSDRLLGVARVNLTASTGAFFQHPAGEDTAPTDLAILNDPIAAFDSFVTMSLAVDDGSDETGLTPDFDSAAFGNGVLSGDWFNSNPDNAQGTPDSNLRVRIARLTLQDAQQGDSISGNLSVGWQHDGSGPFTLTPAAIEFGCASPTATPEIVLEQTAGETRISWTALPLLPAYDVIRGDLELLRATAGDFSASTVECMADNDSQTIVVHPGTPPSGSGFWFLARAVSCDGGTYDSGGTAQFEPRDAEIAASAAACP